ncbi:YeiH family protein [Streptomyces benahoarensis]|uniref:Putative sulfate exporter family transporter n=1 Tax=Streptomyces benahoarensis TaxID=2595054 RepID=A0A553ZLL9_9ACTN|nr:putative sulfate exporter family transporter [Streptomyces benahoarensis]TSB21716.1 putative sulfate exporter family transporter [Streptomyces benahoarensis]TSB42384.1 putative sulfate exporter family transporter [Streptomyces benahoarensis]
MPPLDGTARPPHRSDPEPAAEPLLRSAGDAPAEPAAPGESPAPSASGLPAPGDGGGPGWLAHHGPGLAVVVVGVAVSYGLNRLVPAVSALTIAVLLGALARNTGLLGDRVLPGAKLATKKLLRTGVVLLGLQLALSQVLQLDPGVLLVVAVTVAGTFAGTMWLGRRMGIRPGTTLLVATGFSICGASAAAAMDAVSDSDEEDLATGVALVTIFGSLAIVLLPLLQHPLGLTDTSFGVWSGASVHEVAQVVATASVAGPAALAVATVVKLTRVVLLAPLIAGYSIVRRRKGTPDATGKRPPLVPLFVLGFIAMVAVRSSGVLPASVLTAAQTLTTLLLAGALFGLGTSVHLMSLIRTGARPVVLGAGSTVLAGALSLAGILAFT